MAREVVIEDRTAFVSSRNSLLASLLVGLFVGLAGWLLTIAINSWVIQPVFCRSADTASACTNAWPTAWIVAHVLVSFMGLIVLIRANVFRPLLVVLAAIITLWTVGLWFASSAWWVGLLWETVLFGLAYALYAWLASAKRFVVALIAIVVLIVVYRLLIVQ